MLKKKDLPACTIVCATIITMVITFMFTLADVASQPPVYSAFTVVPPEKYLPKDKTNQSRATKVSRRGRALVSL